MIIELHSLWGNERDIWNYQRKQLETSSEESNEFSRKSRRWRVKILVKNKLHLIISIHSSFISSPTITFQNENFPRKSRNFSKTMFTFPFIHCLAWPYVDGLRTEENYDDKKLGIHRKADTWMIGMEEDWAENKKLKCNLGDTKWKRVNKNGRSLGLFVRCWKDSFSDWKQNVKLYFLIR